MKKISLIIASLIFSVGMVVAQPDTHEASHNVKITVPTVALIDIEGGSTISFELTRPTEAGSGFVAPDPNNTLWLNMTSVVTQGTTRAISVGLSEELSPALSLKVTAANKTGAGHGTFGTAGNTIIETAEKPLITGIGSGYTGNGANHGYNLTYDLIINADKYKDLYAVTDQTVVVTYTLTDVN